VDVNAEAQKIIARIPERPEYGSAEKLVKKLNDSGIPCDGGGPRPQNKTFECDLVDDADANLVAAVFGSVADRDALLRRRLRKPWLPQVCVFGANWFVTLDAGKRADQVAHVLGGTVVRIGPPDLTR
jgi:hypothetical protein